MSFLPNLSNQELTKSFSSTRIQSILIHAYTRMKLGLKLLLWTRGTFRQVPTRRIRLSFVECSYSYLRDIFFHNLKGLKWIPLWKRMAPNFKTTTLAHSRLSLILNNNNMAWSFVFLTLASLSSSTLMLL